MNDQGKTKLENTADKNTERACIYRKKVKNDRFLVTQFVKKDTDDGLRKIARGYRRKREKAVAQ